MLAASAGVASDIAVARGQPWVDPAILPLACLTLQTTGAALPLYRVDLREVESGEALQLIVGDPDNPEHLAMLTANANGNQSLSQAILRLKPGTYEITGVIFLDRDRHNKLDTSYGFDLAEKERFFCRVNPGCANYLGTLVINADWGKISYTINSYKYGHRVPITHTYQVQETSRRDFKWAGDLVPGMRKVPSVPSPIHVLEPTAWTAEAWQAVKGVKTPPTVVTLKKAEYPVARLRRGVAGDVVVSLVIGPEGEVESAAAVSSPNPELSVAAVEALRGSKFRPGLIDGFPTYFPFEMTVTFSGQ